MKKSFFVLGVLMFFVIPSFALANGNHKDELLQGKQFIESGVRCDEISEDQLEAIGEYLMEQLHPVEAHDVMHKMMNMEEGTEYHNQFHVNIAKMMYCGEGGMMGSGGMKRMMNMMGGGNMMGSGGMMGGGMIGPWAGGWGFGSVLYTLLLLGLIMLVWLAVIKFWRELFQKRK